MQQEQPDRPQESDLLQGPSGIVSVQQGKRAISQMYSTKNELYKALSRSIVSNQNRSDHLSFLSASLPATAQQVPSALPAAAAGAREEGDPHG